MPVSLYKQKKGELEMNNITPYYGNDNGRILVDIVRHSTDYNTGRSTICKVVLYVEIFKQARFRNSFVVHSAEIQHS